MINSRYNGYPVHLVENVSEFLSIKKLLNKKVYVGLDTETSGLDFYNDDIAGICISCGNSYDVKNYHGFYMPLRHIGYVKNLPIQETIEFVQFVIDNYVTMWWNRDFDASMLEKEGINFPCVGNTHDVQCMAHLYKGDSYPALKDFAHDHLKMDVLHFSDNEAKDNNFKTTDPTVSFVYASGDPIITVLVGRKLWSEYSYIHKIYSVDNKFADCMRRIMYSTDLYLDKDLIDKMLDLNSKELAIVKSEIFSLVGYTFKLDSNVDKADALLRFVSLTAKTSKGQYRVDKEVLQGIDHPLAKLLLKYANLTKFRGTYLLKMKEFPQPFHINYQHCNVSCLTEANIVRCLDGYKSIKDVREGDFILTENGFRAVEGTSVYEDLTLKITLENGAYIEGNSKHPVLVNELWKGLGDLKIGDRVTMCRTTNLSDNECILPDLNWEPRCRKKFEFSKRLDNELAYLLGFIDGDGSLTDGVKLCFSVYEPELENYVVNLFSKRFNMDIPVRSVGSDNTVQYKFCSRSLVSWLKNLGVKPHGTEMGINISSWGSSQQFSYVAALFDTDGSVNRSGKSYNIRLGMTSKSVIDNVVRILRFHGIDVKESVSNNRKQILYNIRIRSQESVERFIEFILPNMHCIHKIYRCNELRGKEVSNHWELKQSSSRVVSVENTGFQKVYDIKVNETPVFIANGIVTHNTGRLSSGGSKGNSFFSPFNIQNVPKIEIFRYLHYAPQSSSIKWVLDDSPYCPLMGNLEVVMNDGTTKALSQLKQGDQVLTSKGIKSVVSCGELKSVLKPYEGTRIEKDGKWDYIKSLSSEGIAWFLDLGEDGYSVTTSYGNIQIRTLQKIKCKGGMRDCFVCPEGYVWISEDYSSQEMVLMANFSFEPNLIEPLLKGEDIHKYVATQMFGHYDPSHRTITKVINFASNYGASGYTIGKRLGKSAQEGQMLLDKYNTTMSKLTKWKREMEKEGQRKGIVYTFFGRPRAVWMYFNSSNPGDWSFGNRTCVNTCIQGCLPGFTRVLTDSGYKPIVDISINDLVWNGMTWTRATVVPKGEAELVRVTTEDGNILYCDDRHKLKCMVNGEYQWVDIHDIEGKEVCINNGFAAQKVGDFIDYLMGYITGDGLCYEKFRSVRQGTRREVQICFGIHEEQRMFKIKSELESLGFHVGVRYRTHKPNEVESTRIDLRVSDKRLINLLKSRGMSMNCNSKTKRVPMSVWSSGAKEFIRGLFESDGCKGQKSFHMVNSELLEEVALLINQFGFPTRLSKTKSAFKLMVQSSGFEEWLYGDTFKAFTTSRISNLEGKRFLNWVSNKKLSGSLKTIVSRIRRGGTCTLKFVQDQGYKPYEGYHLSRVKSVEFLGERQDMFTLATEHELHQFVTEGFISKNTGGDIIRIDHIKLWGLYDRSSKTYDKEFAENTKYAITVHDEINLFVKPSYVQQAVEKLRSIMEMQFPSWRVPLRVSPSVGVDWGHQIEIKGFDENGVIIPDCEEDLSLL